MMNLIIMNMMVIMTMMTMIREQVIRFRVGIKYTNQQVSSLPVKMYNVVNMMRMRMIKVMIIIVVYM